MSSHYAESSRVTGNYNGQGAMGGSGFFNGPYRSFMRRGGSRGGFRGKRRRGGSRFFGSRQDPRWMVSRAIRAIGRPERKYIDTMNTLIVPTVTTVFVTGLHRFLMNASLQGVTSNVAALTGAQRLGNQILVRGWRARMSFQQDVEVSSVATSIRVMVVIDKQPNGISITSGNLFENTSTIDTMFVSPYDHNLNRRHKILYDRSFVINNPVTGATAEQQIMTLDIKGPLYLPVQLESNNADITDFVNNALWLIIIPYNHTPGAAPGFQNNIIANVSTRCWFTDA